LIIIENLASSPEPLWRQNFEVKSSGKVGNGCGGCNRHGAAARPARAMACLRRPRRAHAPQQNVRYYARFAAGTTSGYERGLDKNTNIISAN
jgi:hypothetical protein